MLERIKNLKEQIYLTFTKIKNSEGSPKDLKIGKMLNDLRELDYKGYEPILQEYKNDVFAAYKESHPKEFTKKRTEIIILEDVGADGRTSRIRFSGINDKKVKIKKPGEPRIRVIKPTGAKDGSCYEFNGQFYGKGRSVHAVIKNLILKNFQLFTNMTDLEIEIEIDKNFLGASKNKYGVVKEFNVAKELSTKFKRFFLKESDLIKLPGGTKLAVSKEWGANNMPYFIEKARILGYDIKDA